MQKEFTTTADPQSYQRFESTRLNSQIESNANAIFGQIDWIGENGGIKKSWQVECESVTIGSSDSCSVVIPVVALEAVHGAVTFGRNHILVQAIEGEIKISGRQIREWLIDEPTEVLLGATKIQITPASFLKTQFASHCLTPGDVIDQASRLQSLAAAASSELHSVDPLDSRQDNSEENSVSDVDSIATSPTLNDVGELHLPAAENVNSKEVANEIKAVIEPLRDSLDAIRSSVIEGLRDLSTTLAERYEQRFQDTSAVIDSRFERLESLLVSSQPTLRHAEPQDTQPRYAEPQYTEPQYAEPLHAELKSETGEYGTNLYDQAIFAKDGESAELLYEESYQGPQATSEVEPYESSLSHSVDYSESSDARILEENQLGIETAAPIQSDEYFGTQYLDVSGNDGQAINQVSSSYFDQQPEQYLPATTPERYGFQNENVGDLYATVDAESNMQGEVYPSYSAESVSEVEPSPESEQLVEQLFVDDNSTYHDSRFKTDDLDVISEVASSEVESHESSEGHYSDTSSEHSRDSESELPAWFTAPSDENLESEVSSHDHSVLGIAGTRFEAEFEEKSEESIAAYGTSVLEELSYSRSSEYDTGSEPIEDAKDLEDYSQEPAASSALPRPYETDSYETNNLEDSYAEEPVESNRSDSNEDFSDASGEDEEESIEVYMQRLLQRAKGGAESSFPIASSSSSSKEKPASQKAAALAPEPIVPPKPQQIRPEAQEIESESGGEYKLYGPAPSAQDDQPVMSRPVPRVSVEEQQQSLVALRELANHTARKAITLNTHKRMVSDFNAKLMIAGSGFVGGTIVGVINGLTPNVAMAGMICAYAVFLLWGYDAWCHSRRLVAAKKEDEVEDQ